jgi:4-amino-4-deoxy-L-arabinose transferase-like glycosyltransferase
MKIATLYGYAEGANVPPSKTEQIILVFLLAVALFVRVIGIDWGLPYLYHPDEPTHVGIVLNILKTGDLNPHWFKYPSFRIYASLPVAAGYFLLGVSKGSFRSIQELNAGRIVTVGTGLTQIPMLYLALRLYMALFGVLAVGLLYYWGKKYFNAKIGLIAALFLALSPLQVLVSHWYRPDTMLALFSGAAVFATLGVYRHHDYKSYIGCGILIGLASSVKYNAAVLQMVPFLLAHFLARRNLFDKHLLATLVAAVLTFVVITPFAILDLPAFLDGFAFEISHYYVIGQPGAVIMGGFASNLGWYLWQMLSFDGLLVLLAVVAPFIVKRERRAEVSILTSWPVLVLVLNSTAKIGTALALVPITLVFCLMAAISLEGLLDRVNHWRPNLNMRVVTVICLVLLLGLPLAQIINRDVEFVRPDVRESAGKWIDENLPADATIALEGYTPYLSRPNAIFLSRFIEHPLVWYQAAGVQYLVASSYNSILNSAQLYPAEMAAYEPFLNLPNIKTISGPLEHLVNEPQYEIRIFKVPTALQFNLIAGDTVAPWFVSGFKAPESISAGTFRWVEGHAVLRLRLQGGKTYHVSITAKSYGNPTPPVTTTVTVNSQILGVHGWQPVLETWSFSFVPAGNSDDYVDITLDTNTWRPKDYLGSADERELGFILTGVLVVQD